MLVPAECPDGRLLCALLFVPSVMAQCANDSRAAAAATKLLGLVISFMRVRWLNKQSWLMGLFRMNGTMRLWVVEFGFI